jgi:hypothetical protein
LRWANILRAFGALSACHIQIGTPRNDAIRLRHMLNHAREAVAMASGKTRDELDTNRFAWTNLDASSAI